MTKIDPIKSKRSHKFRCVLLFLILSSPLQAQSRIEVFTIASLPVTRVPEHATVIELDRAERLDQRLSQALPDNRAAAIRTVKQRLDEFKDTYVRAYRGLVRAWRLGVKQVPAVVVDGQYVVYGETNVARALEVIRNRQEAP